MRIPENAILSALRNGGCIKSFYRRSVRGAQSVKTQLADGYVLASPGDHGEVILSHADFLSVKTKLAETETWEQVVGNILFGGSTWKLRPEMDD
ncbi:MULTISPECIES: cytoplasmic protein [Enterobacterales]|uniref:Cytoplasmic protein n=1 Tax=Pectobacterium carotovorum TaxID=554 RepID=A0A0N9NDH2_PECCA|nr:cytoplasmic protein [Pectobacterium carotovorum]ALG88645.1 Cytoplasmic protein [Pectobacterium carotovorum]